MELKPDTHMGAECALLFPTAGPLHTLLPLGGPSSCSSCSWPAGPVSDLQPRVDPSAYLDPWPLSQISSKPAISIFVLEECLGHHFLSTNHYAQHSRH